MRRSGFVQPVTVDARQSAHHRTRRGVVRVDTADGPTAGRLALHVLGRRSGMPGPGEPSSGYVVRTDGATLLLDCGPGVAGELRGLLRHRPLDAVFISHLHMDHCYDLVPVAKTLLAPHLAYPGAGQENRLNGHVRRVPCHLPPDGVTAMRTAQALFPVRSTPPLDRAFDLVFDAVETAPEDRYTVGDCTVSAVELRHAVPVCGFRVESGAGTMAYTGDTGWTDALVDLAAGVDLLLCEATLREPDTGMHGHLAASEAGRLAALADVGALVLTHVSSCDDEHLAALVGDAADEFDGPILVATPRTAITFHRTGRTARP